MEKEQQAADSRFRKVGGWVRSSRLGLVHSGPIDVTRDEEPPSAPKPHKGSAGPLPGGQRPPKQKPSFIEISKMSGAILQGPAYLPLDLAELPPEVEKLVEDIAMGPQSDSATSASAFLTPPQTLKDLVERLSCSEKEKESVMAFLHSQEINLELMLDMREQGMSRWQIPRECKSELWAMVESLKKLSADFSTWDERGVSEWLLSIGRGDLVKAFQDAGITGLSLVLLTEEDLEQHLGVDKTGVRMKLVTELNNLRDSQPTALDRLSAKRAAASAKQELVSVPLVNNPQDFAAVKGKDWDELAASASQMKFSPVVAFAGPTGAGKSRLLTTLLSFKDRMSLSIPLVAAEGQGRSTTGNISLFKGSVLKRNNEMERREVFLLDLEGENGNLPTELVNEAKRFFMWTNQFNVNSAQQGAKEHLLGCLKSRMEFIRDELPKIAYLISNVLVFVDRQPMHNTNYLKRVQDFSARASPGLNASDRPHLIFVQNFCPDNNEHEYDIERSTKEFRSLLEAGGELDQMESNFASLSFVKIPDAVKCPDLFGEQIGRFQDLLMTCTDPSAGFMLDAENFFTEHHWYKVVDNILLKLSQREPSINMAEIFLQVCRPNDELLAKALQFFTTIYDTLYIRPETPTWTLFSTAKLKPFLDERIATFQDCLHATLFKMAELFVKNWKDQKIAILKEHLARSHVKRMLTQHFDMCYRLLLKRAPCAFNNGSSICILEKMLHADRHRFYTPLMRRSLWGAKAQGESDFVLPPELEHSDKICEQFLNDAAEIMEISELELHVRRLDRLKGLFNAKGRPPEIRDRIRSLHMSECCLVCLQNPAMVLLSCGHTICRHCNRLSEQLGKEKGKGSLVACDECPFCGEACHALISKEPLPRLARPRILSLDGGGFRGVVMLTILGQVESIVNAPMHKLFDMISGTSAGAFVAGGLGIGEMSVAGCQELSWMLSKRAFPTSFLPKIIWNERIDNKLLYDLLKAKFGEKTLLDIAHLSPKVLIGAHDVDKNSSFVFGSFASSQVDWDARVVDALIASAAVPTFLPPVEYKKHVLVDGGFSLNNPSPVAFASARELWARPPGLVLSLGTGLPSSRREQQGRLAGFFELIAKAAANSERGVDDCRRLCALGKVPCFWRLNVPDLGDIGLTDTSKKERKKLQALTLAFCEQEKDLIKDISMHILAQLLYVDDSLSDNSPCSFHIRSRKPGHFRIANDTVHWKDATGREHAAQLRMVARHVTEHRTLSLSVRAYPEEVAVVVENPSPGEYRLEAQLQSDEGGVLSVYPIGGSPCSLWLDRVDGHIVEMFLGHKLRLSVTVDHAKSPKPISFVTIRFEDREASTRKLTEESTDPIWKERFDFMIRTHPQDIHLRVSLQAADGEEVSETTWPLEELEIDRSVMRGCTCLSQQDASYSGQVFVLVELTEYD